jgi:hypothetical protein
MTTELWMTLAGIAALIVTYHLAEESSGFDLFELCLLCTIAGMAYVVSRGFAKSGVRRDRRRDVDHSYG